MLLGNKPILFQTTQSRGSNWAIVVLCSHSLFFRLVVKSLLNVFSLVFDFLGGTVKVLSNFKQAPLQSVPFDKGFGAVAVGAAVCVLWSDVLLDAEIIAEQPWTGELWWHPIPLLTTLSSAFAAVCLLSLWYWNGNGMVGLNLTQLLVTLWQSWGLLLILANAIPALGKLAEIRCNSETAANSAKLLQKWAWHEALAQ